MALPVAADLKSILRVEDAAEDVLFSQLLARAQAVVETFIGYPLTAIATTYIDYAESDNTGLPSMLGLPGPFATSPAPVVTDVNGTTVDATTYYLDQRGCALRGKLGTCFYSRPYTIVATIGLSAHPDYASRLEAIASTAIVELVAHWYQNRNPGAGDEIDEGGTQVTQVADAGAGRGFPPRVLANLQLLPRARGVGVA